MSTLHDSFFETASLFAERIAVRDGQQALSFNDLATRVGHLAGALESLGLRKGDRISLIANNRIDYLTYHLATSMTGVILHVMNTRHVLREWLWAMNDAGSSALIVDETHAYAAAELRAGCPSLRSVIGMGDVPCADHSTATLVAGGRNPRIRSDIAPEDPVMLIYTSGTTGTPKGCLQTQRGSTTIDRLTAGALRATENDVYMAIMPYFHQAGMIRSRAIMLRGGTNVVPGELDMDAVADLMVRERVTVTMLVSAKQVRALGKAMDKGADFTPLRLLISGGGTGPRSMAGLKRFCDRLGCDFMGIWGQTECTGPVTVVHHVDAFSNPLTCGRAMPGIDLQIWDDAKQVLSQDEVGEIMVRSEMTAHYWNNAEANDALYTGKWLHTGDLGRLDEQGYLYFEGRKKDLIKTGGENVYPLEVEVLLNEHPAVREVAVIGLPDREWGEAVAAVVVSVDGNRVSTADLREFCRNKIAGYKIPRRVETVAEIPKNETGKVLKALLRRRFQDVEHT
ncbi:MAG: AMP-binding protein [Myxococcales bacterium]|nr:AMP-binding protein [Myxococcales bacterium]MDD9968625.1 AMP-binding protein [Myxococcales bacterium]